MRALVAAVTCWAAVGAARADTAPDRDADPRPTAAPETAAPETAAPETVAVASGDAAFRGALHDALQPTGVRIIATNDEPPPITELSITARRIAERERAAATVWLIVADDKTTLVIYDRDVDRVLVREVPYSSPLAPAQAAEVARMARTMLRALRVTPEVDLPLPRVDEARSVRAQGAAPAGRDPRARALALSTAGNVRVGGPGSDTGFDARLGASWRPDAPGLDLQISFATGADLSAPPFKARVSDAALALSAHAPLLAGRRLRLLANGGVALHTIALEGKLRSMEISDRRFDPALRLGFVGTYAVTRIIDVGLAMSADALLLRQVYSTGTEEVLVVPRLQLTTGVIVSIGVL